MSALIGSSSLVKEGLLRALALCVRLRQRLTHTFLSCMSAVCVPFSSHWCCFPPTRSQASSSTRGTRMTRYTTLMKIQTTTLIYNGLIHRDSVFLLHLLFCYKHHHFHSHHHHQPNLHYYTSVRLCPSTFAFVILSLSPFHA